jgi:hypothetical protein
VGENQNQVIFSTELKSAHSLLPRRNPGKNLQEVNLKRIFARGKAKFTYFVEVNTYSPLF